MARLKGEDVSRRLVGKIDDLIWAMSRSHVGEYVELFRRPRRLIWLNFLAGLARGLGTAIGFTILGALLLWVLTLSFVRNLPVIGSFIADLIVIINQQLGTR